MQSLVLYFSWFVSQKFVFHFLCLVTCEFIVSQLIKPTKTKKRRKKKEKKYLVLRIDFSFVILFLLPVTVSSVLQLILKKKKECLSFLLFQRILEFIVILFSRLSHPFVFPPGYCFVCSCSNSFWKKKKKKEETLLLCVLFPLSVFSIHKS